MKTPLYPPQDPYNNELLIDYLEGLLDSATHHRIEAYLRENEYEKERFDGLRQLYKEYNGDREKVLDYLEQARSKSFAAFQARRGKSIPTIDLPSQAQEESSTATQPLYRKWLPLSIAASLIVLVAAYFLFYSGSSPTELATTWSQEPYPAPEVLRSSSAALIESWVEAYEDRRFADAAQLLEAELTKSTPPKAGEYFFAGITYLQPPSPDLDKAIQYLKLAQQTDPAYEEQARWYLALTYLQNKQPKEARTLLEEIVSTQSYQNARAEQLLSELP